MRYCHSRGMEPTDKRAHATGRKLQAGVAHGAAQKAHPCDAAARTLANTWVHAQDSRGPGETLPRSLGEA